MDSFLKNNAPEKGYILAFYPDTLVFEPYTLKDGKPVFKGCEALRDQIPWECHLFDHEKECRRIYRESAGDWIEQIFTRAEEREMDPDLLFEEEVLVKPEYAETGRLPQTLMISNRYRYSEHDTLMLDNYRIGCRPADHSATEKGGVL